MRKAVNLPLVRLNKDSTWAVCCSCGERIARRNVDGRLELPPGWVLRWDWGRDVQGHQVWRMSKRARTRVSLG